MKFHFYFFFAVLNGGISTYRPMEISPCEMRNMDAFCNSRNLDQIPPALHQNVNKIVLSENKLQNITERPLTFYTSLRHLDFNSNHIGFIKPGIFSSLRSLEEIHLANNQLYRMAQSNLWVGLLPHVRTLDLSRNRLYNGMAEHFLHKAPSLQYLSLAENSIIEISQKTFQGSPSLIEVNLHSNMIMEIEEGAFESLSQLSKLNLSMNSLTCIAGFDLKQLRILDLSRNSIEIFHSTESKDEFNLIWLDLSENKLLHFPVLPQVNKLAFLNLTKNILQSVLVESLGEDEDYNWEDPSLPLLGQDQKSNASSPHLPELLHLDLSYNEIKSIPSDFFTSMSNLQFLNLSKNCLQTFVANSELVSLAVLDISSNSLQDLEVDVNTLGNLQEFYLQENYLQALRSDIFKGLPHLWLLNLRSNNLSLCSFQSRLARQRPAAEEDGCISFVDVPELQHLYLSDNKLKSIPVYGFYRTQLVALDLSMNWGLHIDAESLSGLELSLEYLDFHGNGMTTLNVNFPLFPNLKYLNLSDNQLSWLSPWTEGCCALEVLDLQYNSFSNLKNSKIPALENNLRNLYLAGNPLSCCGNIWLSHMIHKATVEIPNLDLVKCQHVKSFGYEEEEMHVVNIRPEDCEKEDRKKMSVLILLAVALLLSLVVIGVAVFCCYRRHMFGRHYKA
nr:PREDICTED: leucine-rich repeat-containing protein 32 [Anolis carolinensis]|eukprot:XP_003227580.3 PREDICTED: leucine-rich repeat-containing protein 32 [Anolis carolinensis]